ncbi:hypothetical protein DM01DRAFT_1337694 [Hesseltinella vesiculosa]|uniref:B30.2/SPRY domain-containing protein n=1 Tax=Hesseltinella vesiculosa TaxID=101127 RepID=A0A1X2GCC7_9FUNG|nr:hypothetical protein DM01DRAFT_1337694 [Hesseltinella vesiculosa]
MSLGQQYDPSLFDSKNAHLMSQWHPERFHFNKKRIVPFVDKNWVELCTERVRTTTWWATLGSCLYSAKDSFVCKDEYQRSAASDFALADANVWHVRPMQSSGKSISSTTVTKAKEKRKSTLEEQKDKWVATNTPSPGAASPTSTTATADMFTSSTSHVADHPVNRFGFKYIACEKTQLFPHLAYRQSENPHGCQLSVTDKSSYVSVAKDGLTVTTDRGFRMCRANISVKEGRWYWEATILRGNDDTGGHVRLGWARREACLNAPVGYDAYSYGIRDKTGEAVFCSRLKDFGESFSTGDVIGLGISLPPRTSYNQHQLTSASRRRIPIIYKDSLWFEEKDYRQSKEMESLADRYRKPDKDLYQPKIIPGSSISIYKNGHFIGDLFHDLTDFDDFGSLEETANAQQKKKRRKKDASATNHEREDEFDNNSRPQQWNEYPPLLDDGTLGYYPAISVFKGAMVTCNFGPDFKFPPLAEYKPMADRYQEYMVEECMWDLVDEVSRSFKRQTDLK